MKIAMEYKSEKKRYLLAAGIVVLLLLISRGFVPFNFETNDDSGMMYIVAGYRTGVPLPYTMFTNIVYGYIVSFLYTAVPSIPWYGIMHLFFVFLASFLILKSMLKIASNRNIPLFYPVFIFCVLYFFVLLYFSVFFQFTTTSALLGSASCILLFTLFCGEGRKARLLDGVLIVCTLLFCYLMRPSTGAAIGAFFIGTLFFKIGIILKNKVNKKGHLLQLGLVFFTAFLLIFAAQTFEIAASYSNGLAEYSDFNSKRARFSDFPMATYEQVPEVYESIGWDSNLYYLTRSWFFMDERVNSENFTILYESFESMLKNGDLENTYSRNFISIWDTIEKTILRSSIAIWATGIFFLFFILHILISVFRKKWEYLVFAIFLFMGYTASVLFLAFSGRMPFRVYFVCLAPAASLLFGAILKIIPEREDIGGINNILPISLKGFLKRYAKVLISFVFIIAFIFPLDNIVLCASKPAYTSSASKRLALEEYVMQNTDKVYIFDVYMSGGIVSPFTVYPQGCSIKNLIFWGGAGMNSPAFFAQLEANSLTEFSSSILLKPDVYFVSGKGILESEESAFLNYMKEKHCASPIVVDTVGEIIIYKFNSLELENGR